MGQVVISQSILRLGGPSEGSLLSSALQNEPAKGSSCLYLNISNEEEPTASETSFQSRTALRAGSVFVISLRGPSASKSCEELIQALFHRRAFHIFGNHVHALCESPFFGIRDIRFIRYSLYPVAL